MSVLDLKKLQRCENVEKVENIGNISLRGYILSIFGMKVNFRNAFRNKFKLL